MRTFKSFRIRGSSPKVKKHVQDLCEQIVQAVNPQKVILFGSYAYGRPNEDSDIDLLVVMPFDGHPWDQAAKIRMQIDTPLALDLLVRTPEYVAERIEMGDFFMQEITKQGKVIYESRYAGMGRQSRRRLGHRAA